MGKKNLEAVWIPWCNWGSDSSKATTSDLIALKMLIFFKKKKNQYFFLKKESEVRFWVIQELWRRELKNGREEEKGFFSLSLAYNKEWSQHNETIVRASI